MRAVVLGAGLVLATLALAGTPVDQGKPGTQGAWPVNVTSGGWTPDGGYIGTVTVIQGPGIDGGQAWNVTGSVGASLGSWELIETFDLGAWLDGGNVITTTERLTLGYPADGGAFTIDEGALTAKTLLAVRFRDVESRAFRYTMFVSNMNTAPTFTFRTYAYENGPELESTLGATQSVAFARTPTFTSGSRTMVFGTQYIANINRNDAFAFRPPAVVMQVSAAANITSATAAYIQLWRLR